MSRNHQAMYKVRLNEGSGTGRQKTRTDQKTKRENEVARRRLLSKEENESLVEEVSEPRVLTNTANKAETRIERLQRWREEKKKGDAKKRTEAQKPAFQFKKLKHNDEADLYSNKVVAQPSTSFKFSKTSQSSSTLTASIKEKPQNTKAKAVPIVKAKTLPRQISAAKITKTAAAAVPERKVPKAPTKPVAKISQRSVKAASDDKPVAKSNARPVVQKRGTVATTESVTSRLSKPTASARAKMTEEKHTFLKSKHQQVNVRPTQSKKLNKNEVKPQAAKKAAPQQTDIVMKEAVVEETTEAEKAAETSGSQSDYHLSDSAVTSPKHSTPYPYNKRKSAQNLSPIGGSSRRKSKRLMETYTKDSNSALDSDGDKGQLEAIRPTLNLQAEISSDMHQKEENFINDEEQSRNDVKMASVGINKCVKFLENDENSEMLKASPRPINRAKTPRRKSSRLASTPSKAASDSESNLNCQDDEDFASNLPDKDQEVAVQPNSSEKSDKENVLALKENLKHTPLIKTPRRKSSRYSSVSNQDVEMVNSPTVKVKYDSQGEAADVSEAAISSQEENNSGITPVVQQKLRIASAKRRSLRIVGLPSSSSETEAENVADKKTPRRASRRKSRQARKSISTPLKVQSDIEESGNDSAIENLEVEDIPLMQSNDPAYHVDKTNAVEDNSMGVLQELCVEKVEGEMSFIEVPVDESMCSSPAVKDSTSFTSLKDDSTGTGPFSPRKSGDMTEHSSESSLIKTPALDKEEKIDKCETPLMVESSKEALITPRSLRSRGRSLAPSSGFKEPGEPLSALRVRSARRKTQYDKTPEQMIEILRRSPMIEMNRRRSRHASSPATVESFQTVIENLTAAEERANQSSPAELMLEVSQGVDNLSLPSHEEEVDKQVPIEVEVPTQEVEALTDKVEVSTEEAQAAKVKPFRDLVVTETGRLNKLCTQWTEIMADTPSLSDENLGQIRSVIGKAQLLMAQRFKQFSGLVDNCEFNTGEKETNTTDLQGFWEMIYFQVEDVNKLFEDLQELRQNGWVSKEPTPVKKTIVKKKRVVKASKPKAASNFAAFRAEMLKRKGKVTEETGVTEPVKEVQPEEADTIKTFEESALKPSSQTSANVNQDKIKSVPSTPVHANDKENESTTPVLHPVVNSVKRLRYAPAVASPLLNDITDL